MDQTQTLVSHPANCEPEIFAHPDITTGTILHGVFYPDDQNHLKSHKPNSAVANLNRGVEYYQNGDLDRAIADFDKAISLDPDFAEAYNDRGLCYTTKGDLDQAISDFDRTIQIKPDFAEAYSNRGTAYKSKDDFDRAIKDYDEAVRLKPDFTAAYNNRGDVFHLIGNLLRAISEYDKALQINPDYVEAFYSREITLFDREETINYTEMINPIAAEDYYERGEAYVAIGEIKKAISDFEKVLELCGNNATLCQDAQQQLEKLGVK
jgi:tetratricopeptide (TPR) repeat protein